MTREEHFMALALDQARRGLGRTHPNPCVGCVIVLGDEVVGAGYHAKAGTPHAEVMALRSVHGNVDLTLCEIYVTLEPCCVQGRTPPCTQAIERSGIRRVVVGAVDPDVRMQGSGIAQLRALGALVDVGVLREECEALIRPFAKRSLCGMPWVEAKWAMSLDGKIASRTGHSAWITSPAARARGHALRDQLDAILVGKGTALADDPLLTCRIEGGRDPWRVLCDARLEVGLEHKLLDPGTSSAPTVIVAGEDAPHARVAERVDRGLRVMQVACDASGRLELEATLRALGGLGLNSVLVEGGGALLGALWDGMYLDAVHAFIAPKLIGGHGASSPLGGLGLERADEAPLLEDVRVEHLGMLPEGADGELYVRGVLPRARRAFVAGW